jgi:hypothetical protein
MALRGVKPETVQKRLKMFIYGAAGCGKTYAAIQFPKPYVIDTEKGTENEEYVDLINGVGGMVFRSSDFEEVYKEVRSLLTEKHDYKTLVIDPLTIIYNDLLERSAQSLRTPKNPDGTAHGAHYGVANRKFKQLTGLLLQLDMNIIITSHAKQEYGENLAVLGQTFDAYKKMDYLFDLMLEIKRNANTDDVVAIVKKTRIQQFPYLVAFKFSYQEVANRYGYEIMEKPAEAIELATPEQITQFKLLCHNTNVSRETLEKWLAKAGVSVMEEMTMVTTQQCIDYLREKYNQKCIEPDEEGPE